MEKPLVLLQHGWAFSSRIWEPWIDYLQKDYRVITGDRNYYGGTETDPPLIEKLKADIAITHSLGLYLLPMNIFSKIRRLVIFSGFEEYHPPALSERVNSERNMHRMMQQFDKNPRDILHDYYRNCYYPEAKSVKIPEDLNKADLFDDLALMNKVKMRIKLLSVIPEILILHGKNDKIVNARQAEILHEHLPNSTYEECDNAGHMMFLTHMEWCLKHTVSFLGNMRESK